MVEDVFVGWKEEEVEGPTKEFLNRHLGTATLRREWKGRKKRHLPKEVTK